MQNPAVVQAPRGQVEECRPGRWQERRLCVGMHVPARGAYQASLDAGCRPGALNRFGHQWPGRRHPVRNLALAHLLLAEAEADRVVYALCAPDGHPTIWRRLDGVRSAFPDTDRRTIRPMAASRRCLPPSRRR